MKRALALACLLTATCKPGAGPFRTFGFDDALAAAEREKKIVLVDFFTTWCPPCKKLDAVTWKDEEVLQWIGGHAVALKIDAEKEVDLARRFDIDAYPTVLLIRADGSVIDRLVGYRAPQDFLKDAENSIAGRDELSRARQDFAGHESDPMARMKFAHALVEKKRYAQALDQELWAFDHGGAENSSFSGVRTSFLLDEIVKLGEKHPPALDALRARRDAFVAKIAGGSIDRFDATALVRLNDVLGEGRRNVAIYDSLAAEHADLRQKIAPQILEDLIKARRYADVLANAVDVPQSLEHKIERFREAAEKPGTHDDLQEKLSFAQKQSILDTGCKYYEVYLGAGQKEQADAIAALISSFDPSGKACAALIEAAIRAGDYDTARALAQRCLASVEPSDNAPVIAAQHEIPAKPTAPR